MAYFGNVVDIMQKYSGMIFPSISQWVWPAMWAFSVFIVLLFLGIWIYTSFAYSEIAKKLRYKKHWLAWIPFARGSMILQLGEFHWAWIFLVLVPVAGWIAFAVLMFIANWRIYEKRKYSGWLALVPLLKVVPYLAIFASIASLIILGFVAWNDKKRR